MSSFWEIVQKVMKSLEGKDLSSMTEVSFQTDNNQEAIVTFHSDEKNNLVLSIFDENQWSLIEDMASFMNKDVDEIVKGLDPSGPNVFVVDPDETEGL